ncbi:MAG: hypothetical protein Q4E05_04395 [Pseudoclavibacter sp.]|nr:hypothetical protein [Pseudoclavibacter sp.]
MSDIEIPFGRPSSAYRALEMLPGALSYGAIALLVLLSLLEPGWAAVYLLGIVGIMFLRTLVALRFLLLGVRRMGEASRTDWRARRIELERSLPPGARPLRHAVIVTAYNESIEVLEPTIRSLADSGFDNDRIILVLAYEERGGTAMADTAAELRCRFDGVFGDFLLARHPEGLPGEVPGKGGNITWAGRRLQNRLDALGIPYEDVVVTTLDSDNRPHPDYLDCVACLHLRRADRVRVAYQPIALFTSNIWDAPLPSRIVASCNSLWNIMSTARPKLLRNFASHSQPMPALVEMDFWSTRTIVEDGHQYWRSYFHFDGDYEVVPVSLPVYQDAVLAEGLRRTLVAQFKQLRRWAHGASDIPYAAVRIFSRRRSVPLAGALERFLRLVDAHVSWACVPPLLMFGAWVPVLLAAEGRAAGIERLPQLVGIVQTVAMVGLLASILVSTRLLPPRPERYGPARSVAMVLQWAFMPLVGLVFNAASAYVAQTRLLLGRYPTGFDVTEKATVAAAAELRAVVSATPRGVAGPDR